MKTRLSLLIAFALAGCLATFGGDGRGRKPAFTLVLPALLPPLVVVQPGISVVGDFDDEVFYADGYYWSRQDQSRFRSRDHRAGWEHIETHYVPPVIASSPPGQYRRYRAAEAQRNAQENGRHDKHDRDRD